MDARKSHFMGRIWAGITIVFFTLPVTVILLTWLPILPEAVAFDMQCEDIKSIDEMAKDFLPYIVLHQIESGHYHAHLHDPIRTVHCTK